MNQVTGSWNYFTGQA